MSQPQFKASVTNINGRTGTKRKAHLLLPLEAQPFYDEMVKAGCHIETENVMAGQTLTVISNGKKEIAVRTTEAGTSVPRGIIDMLIGKPWAKK